jgi:periplasmic protein TonB
MSSFAPNWIDDDDPQAWRRWTLAAAVVVCAYALIVGGYLLWHPEPDQFGDNSPVISLELEPIDSVADSRQVDMAPAPEEMIEQKAVPTPPTPTPVQPKVEEPPPPEPTPSELTLQEQKPPPQKVEEQAPPAPVTAAPVRGGAPQVAPSWQTLLIRKLQQAKRYPSEARARGEQGVALLTFSVDRAGHVLTRRIVRSTGHPDLDNEAMELVARAQPLPAFPPSMTQAQLNLTVPIRFSLR